MEYDTLPKAAQIPVSSFGSFQEAQSSLTFYLHEYMFFLGSFNPDLPSDLPTLQAINEQHTVLKTRHAAWCKAFDRLLETGPVASENNIAKMQVWRIMIDMTLEFNIALGEMAWDSKIEMFCKLVAFAEIVVQQQAQPRKRPLANNVRAKSTQVSGPHLPGMNHRSQYEDAIRYTSGSPSLSEVDYCQNMSWFKPVYSLDLGIIAPLYMAISRCRDPSIRRRALKLLACCNRCEGIWDSTLSARVGERIIAIEEQGAMSQPVLLASQIPEHSRIRDLHTKFGTDRRGLIRYTKSVTCVGPNDMYEELLEW